MNIQCTRSDLLTCYHIVIWLEFLLTKHVSPIVCYTLSCEVSENRFNHSQIQYKYAYREAAAGNLYIHCYQDICISLFWNNQIQHYDRMEHEFSTEIESRNTRLSFLCTKSAVDQHKLFHWRDGLACPDNEWNSESYSPSMSSPHPNLAHPDLCDVACKTSSKCILWESHPQFPTERVLNKGEL